MTDEKVEFTNYYFKFAANKTPLMSGLPLPNYDEATNTVSNVRFVDCIFHYDCNDVDFVNCDFIGCALPG